MLYGNGTSSDFIGSGIGVPYDCGLPWVKRAPTKPVYKMPLIGSLSGLHYPANLEKALFAVKIGTYEKSDTTSQLGPYIADYTNSESEALRVSVDGSYSYTANELSLDNFAGAWTNLAKPHDPLYLCQNWWEFATYKNEDISHMNNYSGIYGGYSDVHFSAWKGLAGYKNVFPNKDITVDIVNPDKSQIQLKNNPSGMPGYMGAAMLFTTTSEFNENKFIGIGFKGLKTHNYENSNDFMHKLYRFTDKYGYFKNLGSNLYMFNDPKIVNVKGIAFNTDNDISNIYQYSGPCFIKGSYEAGVYTNAEATQKTKNLNITLDDFIYAPNMESSISYLSINDNYEDMMYVKPASSFIGFGGSSGGCHVKIWADAVNDTLYYESKLFGPGIPYSISGSCPLTIGTNATELHLGKDIEGNGALYKTAIPENGPNNMDKLKKVTGSWKYARNITQGVQYFFNDAPVLETIPSSWEGLDNISTTMADNMFYHCYALTAIPSSFNHYGNKALTSLRHAFSECHKLQNWLKTWENLDNVAATDSMCYNCSSISAIPDSFEHLGSLTSCPFMFAYCTNLREIKSWQGIDSLDNGESMFTDCYSLSSIPSTWDGINRKFNVDGMFMNCYNLKSIPNSTEWNKLFQRLTVNNDPTPCNDVVSMAAMFSHCSAIGGTVKDIIDVFKTYNISGQGQFLHCSGFSDYYTYWNDPAYSAYLR